MEKQEKTEFLLEMRGIGKQFPGVRALDDVTLRVRPGTVHALMGENGAGKSTLMKCLFGIYSHDSGRVLLDGKEVHFKSPVDALRQGVAMVHQELNQALSRTVMDNIWLGRYPAVAGVVSERRMRQQTQAIFETLGMEVDPGRVMRSMSVSQRQMVEIAKAVSYDARVIVFDEPTSSLNEREVEHLFAIIDMLRSRGCAILYISHKMEEILRISDEVTVMRDGRWVATERAEALDMDTIIRLMVGRELTSRFPARASAPGEVVWEVEGISGRYNHLRDVSFTVRRGEILGVAGLGGAGRSELLETVFGVAVRDGGVMRKSGRPIENRRARQAIREGFALVTEERRATGIFGVLSVRENTVISSLRRYRQGGIWLSEGKMRRATGEMIEAMQIKAASQKTQIRTLSGGNQQKVIFGRWLLTEPEILLLDEPTRGIDIGAKYEIYRLMVELAARGCAMVMVSSEMPELLGVCDRILVLSEGRVAGVVDAKETDQEEIMALASGGREGGRATER